ncbi:adenosine deaminase-like [Amphiura filiformis]|uniref:adenosine deaminase-like n=1 Tax=Amphiura filiformis TaxID=82378 RepID=UPI003B218C70
MMATKQIMPKVELHLHLDGAMRPASLLDIARKRGLSISTPDEVAVRKLVTVEKIGDWERILGSFSFFMPIIAGDKDALERIAYELCEDKAKEGVVYFEARFSPHFLADKDVPLVWGQKPGQCGAKEVVAAVSTGLRRGCEKFGIKARLILCCIRDKPEWSMDCVRIAQEFQDKLVAGIDLAANEAVPMDQRHIAAYQEAYKCGIHRTAHAGELGPPENVREAIEQMKVERIGHGYAAVKDEQIYKLVQSSGVHIEVCPTSGKMTGSIDADFTKHPAVRFNKDDLNFSLSTDDPLLFNNIIDDELNIGRQFFGMSEEDIHKTMLNAAKSSFLPQHDKQELLKDLQKFQM